MQGRGARSVVAGLILAVVAAFLVYGVDRTPPTDKIGDLFEARASGVWVEATGEVDRLLADDTRGSRHQRFIVRLPSNQTVLVSHNIDLAPRVAPLSEGDVVTFRGRYEWNDRGGVVHWTHDDPRGRGPRGWIRRDGREFR